VFLSFLYIFIAVPLICCPLKLYSILAFKTVRFIYIKYLNNFMFEWFFGKGVRKLEKETKKGFSEVKKDMDVVGKWIKYFEKRDKQVFDVISTLKNDLSSINNDIESLRLGLDLSTNAVKNKQAFKKLPVLDKQTGVEDVYKVVQTSVQTDNIYDILKGLSSNERLLIMTIMNNEMKLSYEDLALLLGKERSTIRGQVNSIKQKREGLIEEIIEKNGKKRIFVPSEIRSKLTKYAKVRGGKNLTEERDG
jgi:predicted transcriptional regulator